jgi:tight adherence protein C
MFSMLGTVLSVKNAWIYLTIRIGEAHFEPVDTCILVLALSVALLSAFNLWQIGQREDRERRLDALRGVSLQRPEPAHQAQEPSWYHRVGAIVVATPIVSTAKQEKLFAALVAAGVKGQVRLTHLIAGKVCAGTAFVTLFLLILQWRQFFVAASSFGFAMLAGAFIIGWWFPEVLLSRLAARRQVRLDFGLPDALDLLVICAEAGLGLDQAIEQVGRDLRLSNREVSEEFAATAAEMRVLADRGKALENLARRAGLSSLRSIIATLNQSIKFGTPLTASLRVLAAEMRAERLARFEERAARLPVLLTIPLMMFILPALMIVVGTPLGLRIIDMLGGVLARGQ